MCECIERVNAGCLGDVCGGWRTCRMGCQGPSEGRASNASGALRVRLSLSRLLPNQANQGGYQGLGDWGFRLICSTGCLVEAPSLLIEPHKIIVRNRVSNSGYHARARSQFCGLLDTLKRSVDAVDVWKGERNYVRYLQAKDLQAFMSLWDRVRYMNIKLGKGGPGKQTSREQTL